MLLFQLMSLLCAFLWHAGLVKCEVYYNGQYVSSGGADSDIQLSVQSTGVRHVTIEPRTLAVPYGHTTQLHCSHETEDDDDNAAAENSWTWLVNGHPLNSFGQ